MIKAKLLAIGLSIFTMAGLFSTNSYIYTDDSDTTLSLESDNSTVTNEEVHPEVITDKNFETTISKGVTLVDFWATWCGPCRRQGPIITEIAKEIGDKAVIGKLDVDKNGETAGKYHVRSIPTIIVFKDGKVVERLVGLQTKQTLLDVVNRYI